MTLLLKINEAGKLALVAGEILAPTRPIEARTVAVEAGRGDARLATYKKKPAASGDAAYVWPRDGFLPLEDWLAGNDSAAPLILSPTDDPLALKDRIAAARLIAVEFPKFVDGRGYSIAVLLRSRLNYRGELRAVGHVLRDQIFYMARCGFDAFDLRPDQDVADCLKALDDFTDGYQTDAAGRSPLFRRRGPA